MPRQTYPGNGVPRSVGSAPDPYGYRLVEVHRNRWALVVTEKGTYICYEWPWFWDGNTERRLWERRGLSESEAKRDFWATMAEVEEEALQPA